MTGVRPELARQKGASAPTEGEQQSNPRLKWWVIERMSNLNFFDFYFQKFENLEFSSKTIWKIGIFIEENLKTGFLWRKVGKIWRIYSRIRPFDPKGKIKQISGATNRRWAYAYYVVRIKACRKRKISPTGWGQPPPLAPLLLHNKWYLWHESNLRLIV